ncbi:heme ABC transporter substrate-binding protein IsdE [Clostridium sp. MSJ-8]|uniref:heme ABC transporter substrate-binding protein IsdE n=1 Tax=Clostridium sp. MSJ-8 TaxID=2841510 RepID=UPI001C0F24EB|nr:heme ABC transporter substrate-binding protein IsdE [Clostridium sp. MSJ-8]MBU5486940.1 heme ABC transporter substrate-binding protein IsdE [Clostridium sp. MSJ-8]
MKKIISVVLSALLSMNIVGCVNQKQTNVDNNKETKIIATSVAVCEILDKLDLDVVGIPTTEYELPERYKNITEVGSPMSPDLEIIKSLNPTDIIGVNTLEDELSSKYKEISVDSTFLNLKSVEGMYKSILDLGKKFDKNEEAEKLVEDFYAFIEEYTEKNKGKNSPKVLILMGLPGSYMVATSNSYVGSLVKLAGGINCFAEDTDKQFVNVNTEELSKLEPDIILRTAHAMPDTVMEMFDEEFASNDIWKHFEAVKEGNVYDLDSKLFGMSANFKYKDALNSLQSILYREDN